MSSFFNRQSELIIDSTKKRLGANANNNNGADRNTSDEGESVPESWVELAPSRASFCSSVEAAILLEGSTGGEASGNRDSRSSPVSLQSPQVEFESLEQVKNRLNNMMPTGTKNTDWIWDWTARPEAMPPQRLIRYRSGQIGSALTTPPNSPEPEGLDFEKTEKKKQSIFLRFEVILGFVVSNITFFILGCTIGYCICKKLNKGQSTAVTYFW